MQTETYIAYIIPYISIKGIHIGYIVLSALCFWFYLQKTSSDCDEFESFTILLCKTILRYLL